jgi:hypothetical protein
MLTRQQFRYAFANVMTTGETDEAYDRYAVPGPGRPVFEQAFANLSPNPPNAIDRARSNRAPLLLIAGAADHQVPPAQNLVNHTLYAPSKALTSFQEFPLRSHLIIAQPGWREVAEVALHWAETNMRTRVRRQRVYAI